MLQTLSVRFCSFKPSKSQRLNHNSAGFATQPEFWVVITVGAFSITAMQNDRDVVGESGRHVFRCWSDVSSRYNSNRSIMLYNATKPYTSTWTSCSASGKLRNPFL